MWKNNRSLRFSTYHQQNIGDQRLSISYKQMAELKDEESTTLMSDETRKQGDVNEIFAVRDQTGKNWVLGLKKWLTSHHSHVWTHYNLLLMISTLLLQLNLDNIYFAI